MQMGSLSVLLEKGPYCVLAAVVRGPVDQSVKLSITEALERIHAESDSSLKDFSGNADDYADVRPILESCLISRFKIGRAHV